MAYRVKGNSHDIRVHSSRPGIQPLEPDEMYDKSELSSTKRLPIDWLMIALDMPIEIARAFIGKTESHTDANITWFKRLIDTGDAHNVPHLLFKSPQDADAIALYPAWLASIGGPPELKRRKDETILSTICRGDNKKTPRAKDKANYPHIAKFKGHIYWRNISRLLSQRMHEQNDGINTLALRLGVPNHTISDVVIRNSGMRAETAERIAVMYGFTNAREMFGLTEDAQEKMEDVLV
jgi:hypothetical protein